MTLSVTISDEELALRAHEGETEAFAGLYERYVPGVYDFIARMSGNRDMAEDVVQSAFANAWRDLRRRKVTGNIKAWLYTIARNEALNQLRHRKRVVAGGDDLESLHQASPFTDLDASRLPDPEGALQDKELVDLVWESAAALSAKEYSLLDMHLRRGLTAEELAASLGVRRGNVYVMLSRLRDSLEESVTAALLMRRGRSDCPRLDAILSKHGSPVLDREVRRSIQAHLEECSVCQESKRRYAAPAEIFSGLALVPVPAESQAAIWAAVSAAPTAAVAGAGFLGRTAQQAARWWGDLTRPVQLAVAGGAATTVGGAVVAVAVIVALGGGGASGIEDPSDVRSTSHQIGQSSDDNIVSISWSRQADADGYSVRWSSGARDLPDATVDLPGDATGTLSPALDAGSWYFHLRTRGENGQWTSTVHLGPFVIEGKDEPPEATGEQGGDGDSASGPDDGAAAPSPSPTAVAGAISGPASSSGAQDEEDAPSSPDAGGGPTTPAPAPPPKPSPDPAPSPTPPPSDDDGDGGDDPDDDDHDDGDGGDDDGDGDGCDREKPDGKKWHRHRHCDDPRGKCHAAARFRLSLCCRLDKLLDGAHAIKPRCKVFRP